MRGEDSGGEGWAGHSERSHLQVPLLPPSRSAGAVKHALTMATGDKLPPRTPGFMAQWEVTPWSGHLRPQGELCSQNCAEVRSEPCGPGLLGPAHGVLSRSVTLRVTKCWSLGPHGRVANTDAWAFCRAALALGPAQSLQLHRSAGFGGGGGCAACKIQRSHCGRASYWKAMTPQSPQNIGPQNLHWVWTSELWWGLSPTPTFFPGAARPCWAGPAAGCHRASRAAGCGL